MFSVKETAIYNKTKKSELIFNGKEKLSQTCIMLDYKQFFLPGLM